MICQALDMCPGYMGYPFVQLLVVAYTPFTLIPEKQCFEERKKVLSTYFFFLMSFHHSKPKENLL
jgi:hypothetical protein